MLLVSLTRDPDSSPFCNAHADIPTTIDHGGTQFVQEFRQDHEKEKRQSIIRRHEN